MKCGLVMFKIINCLTQENNINDCLERQELKAVPFQMSSRKRMKYGLTKSKNLLSTQMVLFNYLHFGFDW